MTCPVRLIVSGRYHTDLGGCLKDAGHDGLHRLFGSGVKRSTGEPYNYWIEWDDEEYVKWFLAE